MQGGHMAIEEPFRLSSVLTSSKSSYVHFFPLPILPVARFDFSWLDSDYHQETLRNLRLAMKNAKKLCAVMLDTIGRELPICNQTGKAIELKVDDHLTITSDVSKEPSAEFLPVNYSGLSEILKKGDTIFLGQYLFTGSENTSVWLEVLETNGQDVICLVKNTATIAGFTLMHVSQVHASLPNLSDKDKQIISEWGSLNSVDFISLSYTRNVEDVRELRAFLRTNNLHETQVFAKIETVEGFKHFDEILQEADGIILGRGNLGIDLPPEKVFLFQKSAVYKCNVAGKPVIIARVVDSMTGNLRPTRAEATDVANAVLDGADGILLGAETLRGLYPIQTIKIVGRICAEAETVCNHSVLFKRIRNHVGEPMSHAEAVASSAVRAAIKVRAALIVVFTSSGRAARLISKYRPPVPVFAVVIPRLRSTSLKWTFTTSAQARQLLGLRGVYPILASPNVETSGASTEESGLKIALDHGISVGLLKPNDRIVIFQKVGDSSVVKIDELPA
ncbi:pyruvate kinase 1, cytosolic isoform X2 [Hevea brasiliensis]|uniref:pyruvate kinase 1, cytosolic isoform X2 n=1 Tax=Hevea brasiliensis TaxID=3981 RepID=UPI0025D2873E|nr:pyruvate kinase 1, cytosolic isoform X2 [Hevea brasiliensis]